MGEIKTSYGLRNDVLIHISESKRGSQCDCICPACHSPLIAKQGAVVSHHFAHERNPSCEWAAESILHIRAKNILAKAMRMRLPSFSVDNGRWQLVGKWWDYRRARHTFCKETMVTLDSVELEVRLGWVVPDIVATIQGKRLAIEIFVTHPVNEEKKLKLIEMGLSCVEIGILPEESDLSDDELREILVEDAERKTWIYNKKYHLQAEEIKRAVVESNAPYEAARLEEMKHSEADRQSRKQDRERKLREMDKRQAERVETVRKICDAIKEDSGSVVEKIQREAILKRLLTRGERGTA